jgi:histidinol-phosphatase (PHP family)
LGQGYPNGVVEYCIHGYMAWVNYHSHTHFCDGKDSPERFIVSAIANDMPAYGFSSHAPVPFPSRWNMAFDKLKEYLDTIQQLKKKYAGQIEIYTGLEVDFILEFGKHNHFEVPRNKIDYTIGSIHYIGRFPDGSHFCFDGQPELFFNGIRMIYQNDFKKAISRYFESVKNMIEKDTPDIIGHLDKIKMHNAVHHYLDETDPWYVDQVEEVLDLVGSKGSVVEVNTRGLYTRNPPMLYPSQWILTRILARKIPVMLNSDAHHPDEITSGFDKTAGLLRECGFRTLRVLLDGKWQDKSFNQSGLLL